jgi:integrase/recombinase XerD
MSVIFDQYTDRLRRKRKSPHTLRAFAVASTRLDTFLSRQGLTAETVDTVVLEDYFDSLGLAPSSVAMEMRYIQAAYNFAARRGALQRNPALDLEPPNQPDREPRIIPNAVLREIREGIAWQRDWIFFHLLAYTGMRRSEVRGLKYDDGSSDTSVIRLADQTIRVLGKGGKMRLVPVHPALGEVLTSCDHAPGRFVIPSDGQNGVALETIQAMVKRMHPEFTPHDYRRTVATSLARNDVPERIIDRIMGWSARTVRDRHYVNIAVPELHRGILKLYADDPV